MKFTFNWLKDHIRTDLSYTEISDLLTCLGIEVEEIIDSREKLKHFVVGHIEEAVQHPNADKLHVCKVTIGDKLLQIVCGAPNARSGIYVAVALEGAVIPASGETLKKGKIRGIESQGMMCSSRELALGDEADGIIELPSSVIPGQELVDALGLDDVIFDVSLTPNRADCFSVRGIARDLSAIGAGELLDLGKCEITENVENTIDISINTPNCDYFSTLAIRNIAGTTPEYIARRLKAVGQNLVSLPVDIANYVCLDIGQPLDKLPQQIQVRDSRQGEILDALNNKQVTLPEGAVVVGNDDEIFSIAGIMGGVKTGYSNETKNILIESAHFNKVAIANAGQRLRITSDSRIRFERGTDPNNVEYALKYVAKLLSQCCRCEISNINSYGTLPKNTHEVELTYSKFNALTGLSEQIFAKSSEKLTKLGLNVKTKTSDKIVLDTPSWRHDLKIEEDVIEEILRLEGYENIHEEGLQTAGQCPQISTIDKLSDALMYNGYFEIKTFPFMDSKTATMFGNETALIELNEASTEFSTLRPTLVASHLHAVKNAINKSQINVKFFEVGRDFKNNRTDVQEREVLIATISGKSTERNWLKSQQNVSIFDIKAILERLMNILEINYRLHLNAPKYYHPGRSGTYIYQKDTTLAYFGEINPKILSQFGINIPVVCFELFLDNVPSFYKHKIPTSIELSQYPMTTRDFSFIVNKTVLAADIINAIKKQHISEIKDVKIFDIYESEAIGAENKAVALEVQLQSDKETLKDEKISDISEKIVSSIAKNCNGVLRDANTNNG